MTAKTPPTGTDDTTTNMVKSDEIPWSRPVDRPLVVDPLQLDDSELFDHAESLQAEFTIYADMAKDALRQLHEKIVEGDRDRSRIHSLVHELRLARDQVRAPRAELRALQETPA